MGDIMGPFFLTWKGHGCAKSHSSFLFCLFPTPKSTENWKMTIRFKPSKLLRQSNSYCFNFIQFNHRWEFLVLGFQKRCNWSPMIVLRQRKRKVFQMVVILEWMYAVKNVQGWLLGEGTCLKFRAELCPL